MRENTDQKKLRIWTLFTFHLSYLDSHTKYNSHTIPIQFSSINPFVPNSQSEIIILVFLIALHAIA